jgi:2-hydroxychromene-2-carboxylate isomerase
MRVDFYFDCGSPWSYLAFHALQPMARELGFEIAWRPVLVGGIFNQVNDSVYAARANPVPAKAAYMAKDMADWSRLLGLKILWHPSVFPVNSVKAMRGCLVAARDGRLVEMAGALFEAYWRDDLDISQDGVLEEVCRRAGFDGQKFFAGIAEPAIKDALRDNTDALIRLGGFGVPSMVLVDDAGGSDFYFGNDRLPLLRAAIQRLRSK